jgi:hypothetical protein
MVAMISDEQIGAAMAVLKKAVYERRAQLLDQWVGAEEIQQRLIALEIKLCGCSTSLPDDSEAELPVRERPTRRSTL